MIRFFLYFSLAALIALGSSCKKDKLNTLLQPSGTEVAANSSIRLFNFYNYSLDVTVNNIPLTTYGQAAQNGTAFGHSIFPSGSWQETDNGNPFFIPSTLVTKDRKVHLLVSTVPGTQITTNAGTFKLTIASIDTVLTDDPLNPKDYYALSTGHLLVVPRNSLAPIQPDHFKIRVINLGQPNDPNNIYGPVTMDYSDGSNVDPVLAQVQPGTASPYVDLPYGAYMFKLFINGNYSSQVAELPVVPNLNVCAVLTPVPQEALWPRVRTFKPGATYSIVITPNIGVFGECTTVSPPTVTGFNGYRIITEQNPAPNTTYARMDAFNALPVVPLSITVDGQPLGPLLPYAGHTDYGIYVQGRHQVQAVDQSGNVLVTRSINLSAYDNYTAWVYEKTSGKPDICFANTDMTSTLYLTDPNGNVFTENGASPNLNVPPIDDGTNGTIRAAASIYAWQTRFLNLASDLPYATFTNDAVTFPAAGIGATSSVPGNIVNPVDEVGDSASYPSASINLSPGYTPPYDPFVIFQYQVNFGNLGGPGFGFAAAPTPNFPLVIRVFQSTPGPPAIVPGSVLAGVAPLASTQYISNPAMYPDAPYMPISEPGIYTTALIGRVHGANGQNAARLVILKHNK